jgi:hypothetical protein
MVCSVHGKNEYKDSEEDWQAVATPKFLVRFSENALAVRTIGGRMRSSRSAIRSAGRELRYTGVENIPQGA